MSQKNSVNPKSFYPDGYLLLTSTSLTISQQEIASKIAKYTTEKIIFTEEKLQRTYICI